MWGWLWTCYGHRQPPPFEIAEPYLDALYSSDSGTGQAFLASDATFRDPTAEGLIGAEVSHHGRDEMLSNFEAWASTFRNASFESHHHFVPGQYVVLDLTYRFEVNGDAFGHPGAWIPIQMAVVTILKIVNGRIQEHLAHADYDEFMRQVEGFRRFRTP